MSLSHLLKGVSIYKDVYTQINKHLNTHNNIQPSLGKIKHIYLYTYIHTDVIIHTHTNMDIPAPIDVSPSRGLYAACRYPSNHCTCKYIYGMVNMEGDKR